ncbi:hypothetical protein L3X38_007903 [Prunus dulcis]|uniref:Uncharacterized protein n=1 Tax=Prunus dulcis TaxID=3755 RepID=A0AAD5F6L0_PRUDU|nr:hypothetical protein L3X38_007903 [Prunus dulcis]
MQQSAIPRKKRKKPHLFHWNLAEEVTGRRREDSGLNQSMPSAILAFSGGTLGGSGSWLHDESNGTCLGGWGGRMWRRCGGFRLGEQ